MKNNKARIYFRTDASPAIGYGHFIRSLALADMLKEEFDCVFATVAPTSYQMEEVKKTGSYIALPQGEAHYKTFLSLLKGDEIVVLDNYFFTTEYQEAIKAKGCKLVCMDDMHDKHYVADVIINHVITDNSLFSKEPYTQCCLGHQWALLRKAFLTENKCKREYVFPYRHIVINFGGTDTYNLTGNIACILKNIPSVEKITAITGDSYREETANHPKIAVKKNLSAEQMAGLFSEADLAILSASTVCLEAKACGIPVAAGYYVNNQREVYENYAKQNEIFPLNNLLDTELKAKLLLALNTVPTAGNMVFSGIRERYISLFRKLLQIKNYVTGGFVFIDYRNLSTDLHHTVWEARNNEKIRRWMEYPEPFPFENHLEFVRKLQNKECTYWAIYKNGLFIASVNIQMTGKNEAERGIFIAPDLLGKGMAGEVEDAAEKLFKEMGIRTIRAYILKENLRSLNYHLKRGYAIYRKEEVHIYLRKELE